MSSVFTIRWGILATGGIAKTFTKDLLIDPSTRDVSDVKHTVTAAASSTSADRAKQFLEECGCPSEAKAYGSYEELVQDKDVDVIYIATPHSHHYQNAMLSLEAGKHVLCEKAFTVNAAQARKLAETAKAKKRFLMEAVWTRWFPLSIQVRKTISDGVLGPIYRVIGDLSFGVDIEEKWGTTNRLVNRDLAGGAMLDLGIYPITWLFQCIYHTVPAHLRKPPTVVSSISKYAATGVDETTSIILTFPSAPGGSQSAHGIALTGFRVATAIDSHDSTKPSIRIQGTKGELQVDGPCYSPTHYRIIHKREKGEPAKIEEFDFPIPGWGMFWEADETARCIRDGKLESEVLSLEESVVIMEVMDEVRRQNDMRYPEKIETTDYPVKL